MNLHEIKEKAKILLRKKTFILAALLIITLFLSIIVVISKKSSVSEAPAKAWQINLSYNSDTKKLSLENLTIINRKIIADQRAAAYSPYVLEVLDKNEKIIFQEKINITEQILYDLFPNAPNFDNLFLPKDLKTVLYVPYQAGASKIIILRENNQVLQVNLPNITSFNFIPSALAVSQSVSCGPITTVFINDNYKSIDQFRNDVSYLENLYNTTPPYNVRPSVFDFKEVDAAQNFGCATSGVMSCMNNLSGAIKNAGLKTYPTAQKFIVLVDNPNALTVDGGIAGLVNGVGGDVIIYTNYVYPGPTGDKPFAAASHELEGHAIGFLWDRYVMADPNYSVIRPGYPLSNCSTNSKGESFWKSAGSTGTFQGCANQNQYAPFPLTCQSKTKTLISGGTTDTIMSAIGCSVNQFDSVEKAWITSNILPYYKPCSGAPVSTITPTPAASSLPTVSPTPVPTVIIHNISGTAFVDSNGNGKQDAGEAGYTGLNINLTGPFSGSTITDSSGKYSFINIPVGNYSISAKDFRVTFPSTTLSPIAQNTLSVTVNFPIPASLLNTPAPTTSATPIPTPIVVTEPAALSSPTPPPTPTPNPGATYTCVIDPSCSSGKSSIQICPLKCTANP